MTGHSNVFFRSPLNSFLPRHRTTLHSPVALLVGGLAVLTACSSPTAPPPFDILSPASDTVSVLPDGTVRFEIRLDPGVTVEYVIDQLQTVPGPVLLYTPSTSGLHTVTAVVRSTSPATTLLEKDFAVIVEVPGNLPPEIVSLTVTERSETDGIEAVRDSAIARTVAVDPDGSVRSIAIDFGDGTPPVRQNTKQTVLEAGHVYDDPGQYWVEVTVTDSVKISTSDSLLIQVLPPNQLPVGSLTVSGNTEGPAPLTVTLTPQGVDPDGTIVKWEIDEEGDGTFRTILPFEQVQVSYEFSEDTYRPDLRLTDNRGDSVTIDSGVEILVFRSIGISQSSVQGLGNSALSANGRTFIWADGRDRYNIEVVIRDPNGSPLEDVPVRIIPLRPTLIAPDGSTNLGQIVSTGPATTVTTDGGGRAAAFLTSHTSTRVEAVPEVSSIPFDVRVEVSRGHGVWVALETLTGVETETIVDSREGSITITKVGGGGFCAGDTIEIRVRAFQKQNSPLSPGGPAANKYTDIRFGQFINQVWFGTLPAPGFANWRTDSSGEIVFRYEVRAPDDDAIIVAWVDGNRLQSHAAINFKSGC